MHIGSFGGGAVGLGVGGKKVGAGVVGAGVVGEGVVGAGVVGAGVAGAGVVGAGVVGAGVLYSLQPQHTSLFVVMKRHGFPPFKPCLALHWLGSSYLILSDSQTVLQLDDFPFPQLFTQIPTKSV